jgi:hypothetical protein
MLGLLIIGTLATVVGAIQCPGPALSSLGNLVTLAAFSKIPTASWAQDTDGPPACIADQNLDLLCTDPDALDVSACSASDLQAMDAIMASSCGGGGGDTDDTDGPPAACSGNDWDFEMIDSYGDGWTGNQAFIYDCDMALLQGPLTLDGGEGSTVDVCLAPSDGYVIEVGLTGGTYGSEVSWQLLEADGTVHYSGGAPATYSTCSFPACIADQDPDLLCQAPSFDTMLGIGCR